MKRKPCTRCEKVKTVEEFPVLPHGPLGRSSWCRQCTREYQTWRRTDRIKNNDYKVVRSKRCANCKITKSRGNFFNRKSSGDGLGSVCKPCNNLQNKGVRQRLRQKVIEAYGGLCVCCGEHRKEFLQLDHKNNDGAAERREMSRCENDGNLTYRLYRKLKKTGFPKDRYQLLCSNCNLAKGIYGECPHERERRL